MRKFALATLGALLLSGCNPSDSKVIDYGKEAIAQQLKDPASANFRNVIFHKDSVQPSDGVSGYVCGEVNGKNSFGGYVGFGRFYIHVLLKTRWVIPAFGVLKGASDPALINSPSQQNESQNYFTKCGGENVAG
ncbi:hypothetical protein [Rouxiella badensis]|uniref:hypothetical protein n=1 Tax=Rouxiella badensis TaxID=1646377 RepID=UPI00178897B4|nr:hypothetical protein [Rouxiella badensis]QOI55934.1 hypothetical protein H2866_01850 [Rouxiella badensis subsp. acadiensis]